MSNYTEIIHITTGSGASNDRESSVGFQDQFGNSNAASPSSQVHFGNDAHVQSGTDFARSNYTNNSFHHAAATSSSGAANNLNSGSFATSGSQNNQQFNSQSLYNLNQPSYATSATNLNFNGGSPTTQYMSQANYASSVMNASSANLGQDANGLSSVEAAILRSRNPIDVNETEEITVLGQRGIWANKSEVMNWRGPIPITEYQINEDSNPEVITKQSDQSLVYVQELGRSQAPEGTCLFPVVILKPSVCFQPFATCVLQLHQLQERLSSSRKVGATWRPLGHSQY